MRIAVVCRLIAAVVLLRGNRECLAHSLLESKAKLQLDLVEAQVGVVHALSMIFAVRLVISYVSYA